MRNSILRKFKICNSRTGVTLIEVLVAIVILAIGLLGVAIMQYMAIGGNAFGREMQLATEVAQERLEVIRSMSYTNVVTGMTNASTFWWLSETLEDANPTRPLRFGGLPFTRLSLVVDNCGYAQVNDPNPNVPVCNPVPPAVCGTKMPKMPNMRAIAVRVCWVDKQGGNHSVTLNGTKWDATATP
jgi:prepilin-type N-terminal cleavage/methylation domain-containing protein